MTRSAKLTFFGRPFTPFVMFGCDFKRFHPVLGKSIFTGSNDAMGFPFIHLVIYFYIIKLSRNRRVIEPSPINKSLDCNPEPPEVKTTGE